MELVSAGDIGSILAECASGFSVGVIKRYTAEILRGAAYLHSNNVAHRDIKGANVLVSSSGICKLADFGVAAHMDQMTMSIRGTPYFISPEMIRGEARNKRLLESSDIWSVGCTVYQMATGEPPWKVELATAPFFFRVGQVQKEDPLPLEVPPTVDRAIAALILRMMQPNPGERPTALELLDDPFLARAPVATGAADAAVADGVEGSADASGAAEASLGSTTSTKATTPRLNVRSVAASGASVRAYTSSGNSDSNNHSDAVDRTNIGNDVGRVQSGGGSASGAVGRRDDAVLSQREQLEGLLAAARVELAAWPRLTDEHDAAHEEVELLRASLLRLAAADATNDGECRQFGHSNSNSNSNSNGKGKGNSNSHSNGIGNDNGRISGDGADADVERAEMAGADAVTDVEQAEMVDADVAANSTVASAADSTGGGGPEQIETPPPLPTRGGSGKRRIGR
jgi:serine/threonine protein kinase